MAKEPVSMWNKTLEVIIALHARQNKLPASEVERINRAVFEIPEGKSSNETSYQTRIRKA
jgi:hypothetical protein